MRATHGHGHGHSRFRGAVHALKHLVTPHSHDPADRIDQAAEDSRDGMRALWISLAVLGTTALLQALVVVVTGSVALLSDTLHNVADALTAVPVGVAFVLARRPATRRFTYGYGRAEDVAGIIVVLVIAGSAIAALIESLHRLLNPAEVGYPLAVAVAGVVGFAGNEVAARVRIRTGRRIGSAALVADGLHARTDAFTSLGVLVAAGGAALGWQLADPIIGLVITAAIAAVTYSAIRHVLSRLMDAVDPALVGQAVGVLTGVPRVDAVDAVRLRWVGHTLHAEVDLSVAADLTLDAAHRVAHDAEHRLRHALPKLTRATVHTHPAGAHSRAV